MRLAWFLPAFAGVVLLIAVPRARADDWPLVDLSPSGKTETQRPIITTAKTAKKQPSLLQKIGTGTKKLINSVGNTLTLKKKTTKKKTTSQFTPGLHNTTNSQPAASNSWVTSLPQPKEPDRPQKPEDFVGQKRVDW